MKIVVDGNPLTGFRIISQKVMASGTGLRVLGLGQSLGFRGSGFQG